MRWWPAILGLLLGYAMIRLGLNVGSDAEEQWHLATRWTARAGFPFLIIAYSASSLVRLWPNGLTKALLRDRRWWGLGFAGAHSAHLCGIVNFFAVRGESIPPGVIAGGGAAYVLMYAMAATSFPAAQRALGKNWKRLHTVGIHYLWLIFAFAYVGKALAGEHPLFSIPYALIALAALGLRIIVWRRARLARA